jgi:predicted RNA-binding Zn-ribbon protein involved in translation (DUF1610 family)
MMEDMSDEKKHIERGGKRLACPHCGGESFSTRRAQLNTAFMTAMGLDWLNRSAEVYVCDGCGRLEWFMNLKGEEGKDSEEPLECIACGEAIPEGQDTCPRCGWTYEE